jgi:hypothetical protein
VLRADPRQVHLLMVEPQPSGDPPDPSTGHPG